MRVVGLDVCRGSIVCCLMTELPQDCLGFFRANRRKIIKLESNREGVNELLAFKPDIAILEPTGVHYSRLWADVLIKAGVEVRWIGHAQLKYERLTLRMPNKNDAADACVMAYYGHRHLSEPEYFLTFDIHGTAATIRMLGLQLAHLSKCGTMIVNRLRQSLAHEWPEMAQYSSKTKGDFVPPLWRFIAGETIAKHTATRYKNALLNSCGLGLTEFSKEHAKALLNLENRQIKIEKAMCSLVYLPEFKTYNEVFDEFGFGLRTRAMVLSHIYPLENYLSKEGKELTEYVPSTGKRKYSKRWRSLAAFKLSCGYGLIEDSSGDETHWKPGGSSIVRKAIWLWIFTRIEPYRVRLRPRNEIGKVLGDYLDSKKQAGVNVRLARSRTAVKAIELLFYKLLEANRS
jgi:Transposase